MDVMAHAERDRAELLALLEGLDDAAWRTPSLCEGWSVRDVVAHVLSFEGLGAGAVLGTLVRGRLGFDGTNRAALARLDDADPARLLDLLRRHPRPTGLTAALGGRIGLVDGMIHQQDVRRPLGRPRTIDPDALAVALRFAVTAPPLRGGWTVRGTRVVATDTDFAHGRGPEARGPGEAVLMVLAGRRGVASELAGPGAERLVRRLG